MAVITSANVQNAIVKLVAAQALPALLPNLVMGNLVNRDYEPVLGSSGDTINVPIPGTMTANDIAEGGSVTTQSPSLGNAQIVLNTHVEATFQVPDITKVLAFPALLGALMQPAINAIVTKIEQDLLNLWSLFTVNTALGGTSAMDEARVDSAEKVLFDNYIPQSEPKFLVIASSAASAMRQIARFSEFQTVGEKDTMLTAFLPGGSAGLFGRIKDFYVFRSQLVPLSTNYKNIAFHRNAIGLVMRRLPTPLPGTGAIAEYGEAGNFGFRVVMSYAKDTLAQQFTLDALYGVGILRNTHLVVVQSS